MRDGFRLHGLGVFDAGRRITVVEETQSNPLSRHAIGHDFGHGVEKCLDAMACDFEVFRSYRPSGRKNDFDAIVSFVAKSFVELRPLLKCGTMRDDEARIDLAFLDAAQKVE